MIEEKTNLTAINQSTSGPETVVSQADLLTTGQRNLEEIAADIQSQKGRVAQSFIEIGRLLNEAKQQLTKHGKWLAWLSASVDISERMAQRYMQLATAFSNPTSVSDLGMTKALALLALPDEKRDDFIHEPHEINGKQKTINEMSTREIRKVIRAEVVIPENDDDKWIIPCQTSTAITTELKSAQNHLNAVVQFLEKHQGNPTIMRKILDGVRSLNETAQKCMTLATIENPPI